MSRTRAGESTTQNSADDPSPSSAMCPGSMPRALPTVAASGNAEPAGGVAGSSYSDGGSEGKSSVSSPGDPAVPAGERVTVSQPDRVQNSSRSSGPADSSWARKSCAAEASVAWPHRSISTVGVNQRRWCAGESEGGAGASPGISPTRYAVSERLFSAAMACRDASESQCGKCTTAAGFPPKTSRVKASIWEMGSSREVGEPPWNRGCACCCESCESVCDIGKG